MTYQSDSDTFVIVDSDPLKRNVRFADLPPTLRYKAYEVGKMFSGKSEELRRSEGCLHVFSEKELTV